MPVVSYSDPNGDDRDGQGPEASVTSSLNSGVRVRNRSDIVNDEKLC